MSRKTVPTLVLLMLLAELGAQDWPQWRGPSGLGVSSESDLPTRWAPGENLAWTVPLSGLGASSPIVWGERVIVTSQAGSAPVRAGAHPRLARAERALAARENPMGGRRSEPRDGDVFLVVEAFNRSDGRRLWEYRTRARGEFPELHEKHNLATPTPATDGRLIYAWFGNGQLVVLDLEGNPVWSRHLGEEYAPFRNQWGHGSSPALFENLVILQCDHEQAAYLVALDKKTGEERWKAERGHRISHATPLVVPGPRGPELIVNSSRRLDAYDPSSGALLWHAGGRRQTPIPSPVFHNGLIYMSRGYRNSDYMAIRPGGRNDVTETHILWRGPGRASYVSSIVHYRGLLYMSNEVGVVTCADAETGETVWRHRLGGIFFASPVAADGKIYLVSETGETFVFAAGPRPRLLAENRLEGRFLASPAVSGGRLFLRSDGTLFCVGR